MQKRTGERADDSALFYVYTEERGEIPMELFRLMGRIAISNGEANDAIDETTNRASSASKKLGNVFSKVGSFAVNAAKVAGTAAIAAVGAVSTGVAALTKSAVENYAEYEQLVGGVETLFKESADKVKEYASQAYKTAGMSANTYMETVTSFSASLLQSLDGDTAKATESANQAIIDMSDNANKMGSDINMIMNAYQGFAKQNYTMLDNLKLGYGGTKEEMERLLEDAQKLSGFKYDISSYDDIIQAIHVIQTDMGITGTTAKEASSTIQGSIGQLKGAWENFMTGMADPNQDFDALTNNLVDSVVGVADNLIPRITATLPRIVQGISQVAKNLAVYIPDIISALFPAILSAAQALVGQLSRSVPELLKSLFPDMSSELGEGITSAFSKIPEAFNSILSIMQSILPLILQTVQDVLPPILLYVESLLPVLIQMFSSALPVAMEIVQRLLPPLLEIVSKVLPQLVGLLLPILDLISPILDLLMPLLDLVIVLLGPIMSLLATGLPIITNLANTIVGMLLPVIQQICSFIETYLVPVIQFVFDLLGGPVFESILVTVSTMVDGIMNIVSGLFSFIDALIKFYMAIFTGDWKGAFDAMLQAFSAVGQILWGLVENTFFYLVAIVKMYWDEIVAFFTESIPNFISNAIAWLQEFIPALVMWFSDITQKFAEWLVTTIVKIAEWRNSLKLKAIEAIKGLIEGIMQKAKEIPSKVMEIGKNIVSGVWKGIQAAKDEFMKNVSGFFGGIVEGAKAVLDIHSPSKKFEWIGEMCVSGFDKGAEPLTSGKAFEDVALASTPQAMTSNIGASNGIDYDRMTQCFIKALQTVAPEMRSNVTIEGDTKGMFKAMQKEASVYKKSTGQGAFA